MTIRSEIVALIDPLVDGRVSADTEPRGGMEHPYCLVVDHLTENPALRGDRRAIAWRRVVQVSLFEALESEDPGLLDTLLDVLDGATIEATGAMHLSVTASTRTPDPDPSVVHHAITCSLVRLRSTP